MDNNDNKRIVDEHDNHGKSGSKDGNKGRNKVECVGDSVCGNQRGVGVPLSEETMLLFQRVLKRIELVEDGIVGIAPDVAATVKDVTLSVRESLMAIQREYEIHPVDMFDDETCDCCNHRREHFWKAIRDCNDILLSLETNNN